MSIDTLRARYMRLLAQFHKVPETYQTFLQVGGEPSNIQAFLIIASKLHTSIKGMDPSSPERDVRLQACFREILEEIQRDIDSAVKHDEAEVMNMVGTRNAVREHKDKLFQMAKNFVQGLEKVYADLREEIWTTLRKESKKLRKKDVNPTNAFDVLVEY